MSFEIDTSLFSAMCRELAAKCDAPPETVLREEVGKVLSRTIVNTPAAAIEKIKQHQDRAKFSMQPATLYQSQRAGRRRLHNGRVLYNLSYRYPNALWMSIQAARELDLKARLAARGLAKQSWLKIAQMLGLSVDAPHYVQSAKTRKDYPGDEQASVRRPAGSITYDIENSQPTVNAIGGDQALQKAIDGRVGFFIENVKHDVFGSLDAIAKKYPGVTISDG